MHALLLLLLTFAPAADKVREPPRRSKAVVYTRITVAQIEALLEQAGLVYETNARPGRDTWLRVRLGALPVILILSDDGAGVASDLHLYTGFGGAGTPGPALVNAFNSTHRFCRASVDPAGDPVLESDVDLDGGVLGAHVIAQLELFRQNAEAFAREVVGLGRADAPSGG